MTIVKNWANDVFDKKQAAYNEAWYNWCQETQYMFEDEYSEQERDEAWKAGYSDEKNLEDIIQKFPHLEEYEKLSNSEVTEYEWKDEENAKLPCNKLYHKLDEWLDSYFEELFEENTGNKNLYDYVYENVK